MKNNKFKSQCHEILFSSLCCLSLYFYALHALASEEEPKTKAVILANEPLHSSGVADKPTMTLALSVEFPTVGALYRDGNKNIDESYSNDKEYIGYFYSKGCYEYINNPSQGGTHKRFRFVEKVKNSQCEGKYFKGNFLNWATSSSVDILRLALSGGDRIIDQDGFTVLQRAVIPAGTPSMACLWNNKKFFPPKKLIRSLFTGNIPTTLANHASSKDLWIANKHDGIYFGNFGEPTPSNNENRLTDWESSTSSCQIFKSIENYANFLKSYQYTKTNKIDDGFFYARVEVCSKNSEGVVQDHLDFGLCAQQPNSNYKPIGVIQKNANNLRIAALGYALDHSTSRYGGVLRSPMRYVGPKSFDIHGREETQANPYAEWDPYTGIIHQNPNGTLDATLASWPTGYANSGVINYLNKFGRTGTATTAAPTGTDSSTHYFGEYKWNDPVSTLYQQALRYLQGLDQNSEAISNIDNNSNINKKRFDGFPVYKDWSTIDPFGNGRSSAENYACLKNSIVVVGDIAAQEISDSLNSNSDDNTSRKSITNTYIDWAKKALSYDNQGVAYNKIYNIVGMSYWAHSKDIRGKNWTEQPNKQREGLRVKSFFFDVNEEGKSADYATRKKTNQYFLAGKYGGYETDPKNINENYYAVSLEDSGNTITYPKTNEGYDPKDESETKKLVTKDSIWQRRPAGARDATGNYESSTYYLQSDARSVLNAFDEIFARITSGAQSISQTASSSNSFNATTNSHIYTATYDMGTWTGNIVAKKLVVDEKTKNVSLVKDASFDPAERLELRTPSSRNIIIGLNNSKAVNFIWSDLDEKMKNHLGKESISSTDPDSHGPTRLNYLRGDRAQEGHDLGNIKVRTRRYILGDIINAGVSYSSIPSAKYTDESYISFAKANAQRLPIIITGANDGMLHAFATQNGINVKKGDEVFAYIPSWMGSKLSSLVNSEYSRAHQAYVDAPSTVADARLTFSTSTASAEDWKTVLVSGTGAGGRGVFALDITNPESFTSSNLLWEFTHKDDSDLGYVIGKPKILKLMTKENEYRWFAAFASGVNNYQSTYESASGGGAPTIFLLRLDKSKDQNWEIGKNYYKITFPVDGEISKQQAPGMVDFSVLWSLDGTVTHLYAGDLHGNIWKLDFNNYNKDAKSKFKLPSEWNLSNLSSFKISSDNRPIPLYIAQKNINNKDVRQAISAAPLLVQGPVVNGLETFYIVVGTGKYIEASDVSDTSQQSLYVLYDDGSAKKDSAGSAAKSAITPGAYRLQKANVNIKNQTVSVDEFIWGRPESDKEARTQKSGWYFDFPIDAERMIFSASDMGNFNVTFNSVVPRDSSANPAMCTVDNSSSNVYDINLRTGGGRYRVSQIGILGPSLFLENEDKTTATAFDSTGRSKRTIVQEEISSGTTGHAVRSTTLEETVGRLSWRQIFNFQEFNFKNKEKDEKSDASGK